MREELAYIERIDRYLDHDMDTEERAAFEQELSENSELSNDVEFYQNLREGISRQAIKLDIKKAQYRFVKKAKTQARLRKFLLGGGSLIIMLIAVFVIAIPENESQNNFISQLLGRAVEKGGNVYTPKSEFFSIDPSADTTLTTANGSKIHLPKGSLTLASGRIPENPIEIEFAETTQADDMVLSGLATGNAGEALESKSIHFINAKKDGEQLYPSDEVPPYIQIPTDDDLNPNIKVYSGKRNKEGDMRWERPMLPDNYLTPVAFKFLDYYPDGFKDSVKAKLPYKGHNTADRALVDSLYFTRRQGAVMETAYSKKSAVTALLAAPKQQDPIAAVAAKSELQDPTCGINPRSIQSMTQAKFERSLFATREFVERLKYIYQSCDQKVLDIYLNNSEKQLWELDEMAFEYFKSLPKEGGAMPTDGSSELLSSDEPVPVLLVSTNQDESEATDDYASDALAFPWADVFKKLASQKLTNIANAQVYATLMERDFRKDVKAFEKEFEKVERQLQKEQRQQQRASQKTIDQYKKVVEKRTKTRIKSYGYKVRTLGWKNLAVIVESANPYPPPALTIKVAYAQKYDHVHAYFAVTELQVIGKLDRLSAGSFQMNEHRIINLPRQNATSIQLVTVGFIGDAIYLHHQPYPTNTSTAIEVNLAQTDEAKAREVLGQYSGKGKSQNIMEDLDFQKKFYADHLANLRMQQDNAFLVSLNNLAFPCCPVPCPQVDPLVHFPEFDITNWTELRTEEGIEVVHPDGRREYILKSKDPERFELYLKKD